MARRNRLAQIESRLKAQDPKSQDALATEEEIRFERMMIDDLQKSYIPTPPTRTFSDRMDLTVDDLTLKLYHFGVAHTDGDIVIHVPELGILFIGDLFHPQYLSSTADPVLRSAVPRWIEILSAVLECPTHNSYSNAGVLRAGTGAADYYDRLRDLTVFEEQATYTSYGVTIGSEGSADRVQAMGVTPSFVDPIIALRQE